MPPAAPPASPAGSWTASMPRRTSPVAAPASASTAAFPRTPASARARSSRSPWGARWRSSTRSTLDAAGLARAVGRARRSAIGTWTFAGGGLVLEGGRRTEQRRRRAAARAAAVSAGVALRGRCAGFRAGHERRRRGRGVRAAAAASRVATPSRVAHLVLMALLPALAEGDLAAFGAALTAIQAINGRWFAPVQGGTFAPGPSEELVRRMTEWGAAGVGQSSWGPDGVRHRRGRGLRRAARRAGACAALQIGRRGQRARRARFAPWARECGASQPANHNFLTNAERRPPCGRYPFRLAQAATHRQYSPPSPSHFSLCARRCPPWRSRRMSQSAQDATRFQTEIVVTPERGETPKVLVPAATVVMDSAALAARPVVQPAELVQYLPGFHVAQSEFYAGRPVVSARGFFGGGEAEYIRLLVDGQPVADVESGLIDWSLISAASIRRVEASRGPGASMYGDSAIGGVIQILTDRAATGGVLTATAGTFESFTADGTYGRRRGSTGFNVSGAARGTGGAFDHSAGSQFVGAGAIDGANKGFTWRWNATGGTRDRDDPGALTTDVLQVDPTASDPLFRFDNASRRSFATAFTLRSADVSWKPQARGTSPAGRRHDSHGPAGAASGRHAGARAQQRRLRRERRGRIRLRGGAAACRAIRRRSGPRTSGYELPQRRITAWSGASKARPRAAAFARACSRRFPSHLRRVCGSRGPFAGMTSAMPASAWLDAASTQRAWSPRGGVVVQLTDSGSVALFAQASRAFKVPTLDQLFDPRPYPDFQGGTFTISNPLSRRSGRRTWRSAFLAAVAYSGAPSSTG